MNAYVQLALIEKAKRVFAAGPEVMLSFPLLSPIAFTASELNSLCGLPETPADYAAAADFARSVNFIPHDLVASSSEQMLWDVYGDVLSRAEVANDGGDGAVASAPNPLLYTMNEDGSRTESEAYKRYRQYRDAWFLASEDYAARKLSGELSSDPAVQQHWRDLEEPALRAIVDDAKLNWQNLGRQDEIERALAAEKSAALRNPALRWKEWSDAFNPDIDLITDAANLQYAPTGLSPRNFAEQEGWLSFELSANEIDSLVAEAPEQFKAVLGSSGRGAVEKVSFEYRSVALVRSWFRPEALTSRIWRSADPNLQLSDGSEPPAGVCPAYATACVFVRNVTITEAGVSQPPAPDVGLFTLNAHLLTTRAVVADQSLIARVVRRRDGVEAALAPQPLSMRAFSAIDRNSVVALARPATRWAAITESAEEEREVALAERFLHKKRRFVDLGAFHQRFDTPVASPPAPPPPPPPTAELRDEISVLAFICKRLPATPDPAPELHWL
jgi:hypothetical protein